MGKIIFILIAAVFFLGIFASKGTNRLIWFFTGAFFFQDRIILLESPTVISFYRFLIFTLLFSEIFSSKNLYEKIKKFPLIKSLIIVFLGMLFIGINDGRHSILLNSYRIIDEFIQSFLIILLCYRSFENNEDWGKLIKFFLIASCVLSIYGLYNFITKSNPYDSFITKSFNSVSLFQTYTDMVQGRFRVNSFVSHPIYYGYLSGILCVLSFYSFFFIDELRNLSLISMPLTFVNLILSNSRTPLIVFFIGLFFFLFSTLKSKIKIKVFLWMVVISVLLYNIPLIQEKTSNMLDVFRTGGEKTSGSTLSMRSTQLEASYLQFLKNPIFGNGFYYINENLGWSKNPEERIRDNDFQGFESYIYHLLIEQGLIGIFINIVFFINIFIYFLKSRLIFKEISMLGMSILFMFLIFIIGTGTVNSWIISLGLIGILLRYIENGFLMDDASYV